jgi:hypothetical protein
MTGCTQEIGFISSLKSLIKTSRKVLQANFLDGDIDTQGPGDIDL